MGGVPFLTSRRSPELPPDTAEISSSYVLLKKTYKAEVIFVSLFQAALTSVHSLIHSETGKNKEVRGVDPNLAAL